jgi:hypothetical protein
MGRHGLDCCDTGLGQVVAACECFGFHKVREISRLGEDLLASQGLCFMELVWS